MRRVLTSWEHGAARRAPMPSCDPRSQGAVEALACEGAQSSPGMTLLFTEQFDAEGGAGAGWGRAGGQHGAATHAQLALLSCCHSLTVRHARCPALHPPTSLQWTTASTSARCTCSAGTVSWLLAPHAALHAALLCPACACPGQPLHPRPTHPFGPCGTELRMWEMVQYDKCAMGPAQHGSGAGLGGRACTCRGRSRGCVPSSSTLPLFPTAWCAGSSTWMQACAGGRGRGHGRRHLPEAACTAARCPLPPSCALSPTQT